MKLLGAGLLRVPGPTSLGIVEAMWADLFMSTLKSYRFFGLPLLLRGLSIN